MNSSSIKKIIFPLGGLWLFLFFFYLAAQIVSFPSPGQFIFQENSVLGFRDLLPIPAPYPVLQERYPLPKLSSQSISILDADSFVTLYEKNAEARVFPASTTKIMTALIALENYPLDKVMVFNSQAIDGNSIGLVEGEQITVENALYGLLVGSGNDAAYLLADNFSGGAAGFISAMNEKAKELHLEDSNFTNPAGYDQEGHFSSARDLIKLSLEALKDSTFAKMVAIPEATVTDISGQLKHSFKNTNELAGKMKGVRGIKTGWTENAGECLVTLVEENGRKIILAILGSSNRFGETKILTQWVFDNFTWQTPVPKLSYR